MTINGQAVRAKMDNILDANLGMDAIWLLPTPRASEQLIEALYISDGMPDQLKRFVAGWGEDQLEELAEGNSDAWEFFTQEMIRAGWCGYVVAASTPVMTSFGKHKSWSWGHAWNATFVADTLEEAIEQGIEWADERAKVVQPG